MQGRRARGSHGNQPRDAFEPVLSKDSRLWGKSEWKSTWVLVQERSPSARVNDAKDVTRLHRGVLLLSYLGLYCTEYSRYVVCLCTAELELSVEKVFGKMRWCALSASSLSTVRDSSTFTTCCRQFGGSESANESTKARRISTSFYVLGEGSFSFSYQQ